MVEHEAMHSVVVMLHSPPPGVRDMCFNPPFPLCPLLLSPQLQELTLLNHVSRCALAYMRTPTTMCPSCTGCAPFLPPLSPVNALHSTFLSAGLHNQEETRPQAMSAQGIGRLTAF